MILVGRYRSPFTRRVAIAMRLLGIPYDHRPLSAAAQMDQVRAFNPLGRVPSLVLDDGEVLYDSGAILDYLDQLVGPQRALVPAQEPERRRVLRLVALAHGVMEKTVSIIYEKTLRPPEKAHQGWIDRCAGQIESGLAALDAIEPTPWLMGKSLTQADITAGVMYAFVRLASPDLLPPGRYPNLDRLHDACAKLPAFAQTQPEP